MMRRPPRSTLVPDPTLFRPPDLERPAGAGEEECGDGLGRLLPQAAARAQPDLCFYLGGADPYEGDRLGRLALTKAGLAARDRLVREKLSRGGGPACVTLAGGDAEPIGGTLDIKLTTPRAFPWPRIVSP